MKWEPVAMRWPAQATQWMAELDAAKGLADTELTNTGLRLAALEGLATTTPGPVGEAAKAAVAAGRQAVAGQLGTAPACLAVTPFQSGVGQGRGNQRFLSAPNVLQLLADKLLDAEAPRHTEGQQALVLLFLGSRYAQLAQTLASFNRLVPVPALVQCQRRAEHLAKLESEKWELPTGVPSLSWNPLPLERCTFTKAAQQALSGQLAMLEGYTADSSPMADLAQLAARKTAQRAARDLQMQELKDQFASGVIDHTLNALLIGPGTNAELRRELLAGAAPGHEWVISAGLMLVGPEEALCFVRELVGL